MAADAAIPGLVLTFAAMVLLIFVRTVSSPQLPVLTTTQASVSAPKWDAVRFLSTTIDGATTQFGVFGYTGSSAHVGWYFPSGVADNTLNDNLFHNLTIALILIPIGTSCLRRDPPSHR